MKFAGTRMKMMDGTRVPKEIIHIIMGCIVLAIAMSNLLRMAVVRRETKGGKV